MLLIDGHRISLTDQQRDIFAVLYNLRGAHILRREIEDRLWHDHSEGGPSFPAQTIYHQISKMRVKLRPTRFRIVNARGYGLKRMPVLTHGRVHHAVAA